MPEGSRSFRALQALDASGELGVRVHMMLPSGVARDLIAAGVTSGLGSPRVKVGHVKFFIDGSLGSETAAMFEPFIGSPANVGVLTMDPADLLDAVRDCIAADLAPAIHAIGDRANRTVLDVLEATRDAWLPNGMRPRIEHVQVLHPADVERFGSLGVVASAQPIHATQDMELVDRLWGSRGRYAYAFGSLEATGATLAKKLIVPGSDTDPIVVIAAVATPAASCPGPIGTPSQCATYSATARFIAGPVARRIATAIGNVTTAVRTGLLLPSCGGWRTGCGVRRLDGRGPRIERP